MSAPHIILDCLPSLCQKLSDLVEVWRSYNKNNFACFFLRHGVEFLTRTTSTWKCTCRQSWILATHLLTVSSISDRHVQTRMLGPCTDDRIYYTVVRTGFRVCAASNAMRAWRDRIIYKDLKIVLLFISAQERPTETAPDSLLRTELYKRSILRWQEGRPGIEPATCSTPAYTVHTSQWNQYYSFIHSVYNAERSIC